MAEKATKQSGQRPHRGEMLGGVFTSAADGGGAGEGAVSLPRKDS